MNKKNPKIKSSGKSQRQLQIGEQIKRILAEIFLQESALTIKNGYITILQADISPDAKNAKIFIDIFGEADRKKILQRNRSRVEKHREWFPVNHKPVQYVCNNQAT